MLTANQLAITTFLVAVSLCGCNGKTNTETASQPTASASASANVRVRASRLVFLDKENACKCTQGKIDTSWGAIQAALGSGNPMKVDRIHMDSQGDLAAPYLEKRKVVAVPALYVLDASGNVLELLQGEFTEAAVRKVL